MLLLYFILEKFNKCMEGKEGSETTQMDRTKFFRQCVYAMAEEDNCVTSGKGCAPTLNMLEKSEIPKEEFGKDQFGKTYPPTDDWKRPETSECTAYKIWK